MIASVQQSLIDAHAHLPIVYAKSIAKRHWEQYVSFGFEGLVRAARNYDSRRGAFHTHARNRIIGSIRDQMRRQTTRLPVKAGRNARFTSLSDAVSYDRPKRLDLPECGLTREERMALTMRFEDDATNRTIGRAIGVSESMAWVIVSRGLSKVRVALGTN